MIPNLSDYARLTKERVGLYFNNAMKALLKTALGRRMAERKANDYYEYYEQLRSSQDEFDSFIALIMINEAYFPRESDTLDLIYGKWIPCLLRQRSGPVRILSAGCSSGEEAYSLAIRLHEKYLGGIAQRIEIYGCDIDPAILAKARNVYYSNYSLRGVGLSTQQRYSTCSGSLYRLYDEIHERVSFHRTNIIKKQLLPEVGIILLRNVSIYFNMSTCHELHGNLLKVLQPQEALFFSNAEALTNSFDILKPEQKEGIFHFCHRREAVRIVPAPRVAVCTPQSRVVVEQVPLVLTMQQSNDWLKKARVSFDEKYFSEAKKYTARALRDDPHSQNTLLVQGVTALEQREFPQTTGDAQQIPTQGEQSAGTKMLPDLAMMWQHQTQQATAWPKQVVYQEPGYWPTHHYLAEMYR